MILASLAFVVGFVAIAGIIVVFVLDLVNRSPKADPEGVVRWRVWRGRLMGGLVAALLLAVVVIGLVIYGSASSLD